MKIELRDYKQITENGWAPETTGINEFAINEDGYGNYGWVICTTEEEAKKYSDIYRKLGVANTNNIEQIICSLFIEGYTNGIEILNAIDTAANEQIKTHKKRITTDGEWWYVDDNKFCHHAKQQALYWCSLNELTAEQTIKYL